MGLGTGVLEGEMEMEMCWEGGFGGGGFVAEGGRLGFWGKGGCWGEGGEAEVIAALRSRT